jgi:hypothetical protein
MIKHRYGPTTLSIAALVATYGAACSAEPATLQDIESAETTPYDAEGAETSAFDAEAIATKSGCPVARADRLIVNGTATFGDGPFGTWDGCIEWCPNDYWAYAIDIKAESSQGGGDDTAMNGVRLHCYSGTDGQGPVMVTSTVGGSGSWRTAQTTNPFNPDNPITGGSLLIEWGQGSGDDTSVNALRFIDYNDQEVRYPQYVTSWGTWQTITDGSNNTPRRICPTGSAVCGVLTKMEPNQGSNDDTRLNGVSVQCCSFYPHWDN